MAQNWTKEQQDAICARGGTLLVSAAAGSGKTAVLVERVIGLITDPQHPCDADRLLVVTFTNAAAAEMRERIFQRLTDMISENPFDINLQRQQMLLQNAHISTIHSFCLDLIRENFEKLDIPPDFRIADQNEVEIMRAEVLNDILERHYAHADLDGGAFLELHRMFGNVNDDTVLFDTIMRLYEFTRSLDDADGFLDAALSMYDESKPIEQTVWGKIALEFVKEVLEGAIASHKRALLKIREYSQMEKAYAPAFESDIAKLKDILDIIGTGDWDALYSAVQSISFERLGILRKFEDDALKEEIKSQRDSLKKLLQSLLQGVLCSSRKDFFDDIKKQRPAIRCLCEIVRELDVEFFKAKLAKGILDFSDLEQLALKLLVKKNGTRTEITRTAEEISEHFDEVLVDEYQDTNPAQDMIFRAVSENGRRLFMVGDVKQSIYSFRQARPELFTQMAERCTAFDGVNFPAKIVLGKNFRSRKSVTDAVNFIFEKLMSKQLGGVDYENEKIIPAASYFEREDLGFAINVIDASNYDGDEDGTEIEARHIARKIKHLIEMGFSVQKNGAVQKAAFRDFCILLRSMEGRAQKYVRILEEEGIPVYADVASGYLNAYEVAVAMSLLKIIDNPLQDVPLTAVLLSPVFGFTPDDIASIRLKSRDEKLYLALLKFSSDDSRFDNFLEMLSRFRRLAAVLPSDRLILRIYDETGMLNIFGAMPNGERRRANLRLLLDYARTYESAGWRGLAGFMRFIERIDRRHSDLAPASGVSENADVVRIMSIHKSKGLEFPICFLAGLSKHFNNDDIQKSFIFHPSCGFGSMVHNDVPDCRFTTLPREVAKLQVQKSMLSEEMRILYVAMTRAKEKLYAVVTLKNYESVLRRIAAISQSGETVPYYAALSAQSPGELILAAALEHHSCGELREDAGLSGSAIRLSDGRWEYEKIDAASLICNSDVKDDTQELFEEPETVECIKTEIETKINYSYPFGNLSRIPSKISVAELTHDSDAGFEAEKVRPSFLEGNGMNAAERGTALHTFMQYCNLDAIRSVSGVEEEAERLVSGKYLLPEQRDAIDAKKVVAFASSRLCKRLRAAKKLWREFRFNIEIPSEKVFESAYGGEKILLQGMADIVFVEDGCAIVADYKTDRVTSSETLKERYNAQLESYAEAVQNILEMPVKERIIYSFHLDEEIAL